MKLRSPSSWIASRLKAVGISQEAMQLICWLSTFLAGASATHFECWKAIDISLPNWWYKFAFTFSPAFFAAFLALVRESMKKSDGEELAELKSKLEAKDSQLKSWTSVSALIRQVVGRKRQRLLSLLKGPCTAQKALKEISNKEQPEFILQVIYSRFKHGFPGKQMRLGLFARSSDSATLSVWYSWNGQESNCMKIDPTNFGLDHANERKAEVAKHYLNGGHHTFAIIEDCTKDSSFHFFKDEEKTYLRSLLLFKHILSGTQDAIILCLDCDQSGYFRQSMEEEYRQLLVEMMERIEYEWIALQVAEKITPRLMRGRRDKDDHKHFKARPSPQRSI